MGAAAALLTVLGAAPAAASTARIAFIRQGGGDTTSDTWARVHTVHADGSRVFEVTDDPPPVSTYYVAWRPDHRLILFAAPGLETVRPDGSHRRPLPHLKAPSADSPTWRPDGRLIAFTANDGRDNPLHAIATVKPGGRRYRRLTPFRLDCTDPTFSPSGRAIAFVRGGEIWRMHADGTHMRRITHEDGGAASPDWSPNGARIAYSSGGSIFTIHPDGSGRKEVVPAMALPAGPYASADDPAWSPSGKRIVFDGEHALFTVHPSGNELRQLTFPTGNEFDYRPDW